MCHNEDIVLDLGFTDSWYPQKRNLIKTVFSLSNHLSVVYEQR